MTEKYYTTLQPKCTSTIFPGLYTNIVYRSVFHYQLIRVLTGSVTMFNSLNRFGPELKLSACLVFMHQLKLC